MVLSFLGFCLSLIRFYGKLLREWYRMNLRFVFCIYTIYGIMVDGTHISIFIKNFFLVYFY